jgi:hypothetical protein
MWPNSLYHYKVISWSNALSHIVENPIFGTHIFPEGYHGWAGDVHYSTRNAESQFLQYALDLGRRYLLYS